MAATKKQHTPPAAVVDPKFELTENAGTYVLRLALPDLTKSDFRVQVDGAGRLTVRGTRTGTLGSSSLHKVFQLPSAASLDDIAGRFEAGVLTLTVPKRASDSSATPPRAVEDKATKPMEKKMGEEDALKKKGATEDASNKAQQQREKQEEAASKSKQEQHKAAPSPAVKKEQVKPKAPPQAPSTAPPQEPTPVKKQEEMKPKAPQAAAATTPQPEKPAPKPEAATGIEKAKEAVAPDSLAERVRRRGVEEQRANGAAAAASAEKEAKTEQEKAACINGWKERAMGELKGLTDMKWAEGLTDLKWADGVVEAARKNKEVVAVGVAAFSLGFLVSQKLFRK